MSSVNIANKLVIWNSK